MPTPMCSFLIKVHSRCNLMCDYCYEYNCGNTSWRAKPREMSWEVYTQAVKRIIEHAAAHRLDNIFFSFHGGEPLLRSPEFFRAATRHAREAFGAKNIAIEFGMQSNATLLTDEIADTLVELGIGIGISLDGPENVHNEYRVYSTGESSYSDAVRGLEKLLEPERRKIWGGFLSVININHDPCALFDHLVSFEPPSMDFLEPHGAWNKLPPGKESPEDTAYGDWLIRHFDYWYDSPRARFPIRKFEEIIEHIFGGKGTLESFGLEPVNLMTIATDGVYETVDCIKAAHPRAEVLGMDVFHNPLDDVLAHPMISARQTGISALCKKCAHCDLVSIGGGGYFAHRYSPDTDFCNPTIYCKGAPVGYHESGRPFSVVAPNYSQLANKGRQTLFFEASRGCEYGACAFCSQNRHQKRDILPRGSLLSALSQLKRLPGPLNIEFADTSFPVEAAAQLARTGILRECGNINGIFAETRCLNAREMRLFARAGFKNLQIGVESLNDDILARIKKGVNLAQIICCLRESWNSGLKIDYNIILDLPGTKVAEIKAMQVLIPRLIHLPPPTALVKFQLQRDSAIFKHPQEFGIARIWPHALCDYLGNGQPLFYYEYAAEESLPQEALSEANTVFSFWSRNFDPNEPCFQAQFHGDTVRVKDRRQNPPREFDLTEEENRIIRMCRNPFGKRR